MLILINDRNGNNFEVRGEVTEDIIQLLQAKFLTSMMVIEKEQQENPCVVFKRMRQLKGVLQTDIAKEFGTSVQYISSLENGNAPISKKLAHKLAAYFNCDYRIFL